MFEMLDDPHPPDPRPGSLHVVQRRARHLRRRRQAVIAAPAAAAIGTVAWLAVQERPSEHLEVVSPVSTTAPEVVHDDRGEVLELTPTPDGWVVGGERYEQSPTAGTFVRVLELAPTDDSDNGIALTRAELRAELIERSRTAQDQVAVTPAGTEVVVRDAGGGRVQVTEYVDDNVMVFLAVPPALSGDALALFDQVRFTPPEPRCVEGDRVLSGVPGCEQLAVRVLPDGTVESL